ncbi:MAG: hypothetical protein KJ990_12460 [Proteobacteria bacterium]|nr:hypothetical protein [Pseudomonadota bacterium]MBU1648250.1 hypothetical protein [Pseudomonadota bacterium]MBU1986144.1 hypothetical protein [Pseudomonadota bacterium]
MKKNSFVLLTLAVGLLLPGCAGKGGLMPVTDTMVTESGSVFKTTAGYTADASVLKEREVHETLRNRDEAIKAAHAVSGMTMSWQAVVKTVQYPGMPDAVIVTEYLPVIAFKEQARFDQPLPTAPSEHPVWKTVRGVVSDIKDGTLIGLGINAADNVLSAAVGKKDATYEGDVQFNQSHNGNDGAGPVTTSAVSTAGESSPIGSGPVIPGEDSVVEPVPTAPIPEPETINP